MKQRICQLIKAAVILALLQLGSVPAQAADLREVMDSMTLSNNFGKDVELRKYADKPILVLAFLGTECPLAKLYGPRLSGIQEEYANQDVAILGIYSNKQDSLADLTAYVNREEITIPVLKDNGNRLADVMGATRTPEVYVLDSNREVRYHGRIDDQYGVGYARPKTSDTDLTRALDELLAGKDVSVPETEAVGCVIGRVKPVPPSGDVTFNKHIAPILNARCVECHRTGEIGPFTLGSYEDVMGWEETILEVIDDRRMPPWSADSERGHFANDPRLSPEEIDLLKTWVKNGVPEGDPADLPEPPKFVEGWRIPKPDQEAIFEMPEKFQIPAQGVVDYHHVVVDPKWTEDKYIYAAEARPGNRSVVHHILVYVIRPGEKERRDVLAGYAPGSLPIKLNDGLAMKVPAGSKLLFELHYTPNGSPQEDLSYVGVCFLDKSKVTNLVRGGAIINQDILIPAGAKNHQEGARAYTFREDAKLMDMTPHMHLRGKSFRFEATFPDGRKTVLLDVPKYDFNWQLKYELNPALLMPKGTKIECTAVYDNSKGNPFNPDASKPVRWGEQSNEEMMIGFFTTIPVEPDVPAK